jgi:hypothetical protein
MYSREAPSRDVCTSSLVSVHVLTDISDQSEHHDYEIGDIVHRINKRVPYDVKRIPPSELVCHDGRGQCETTTDLVDT